MKRRLAKLIFVALILVLVVVTDILIYNFEDLHDAEGLGTLILAPAIIAKWVISAFVASIYLVVIVLERSKGEVILASVITSLFTVNETLFVYGSLFMDFWANITLAALWVVSIGFILFLVKPPSDSADTTNR